MATNHTNKVILGGDDPVEAPVQGRVKICFYVEKALLEEFDKKITPYYGTRSEAIRTAMRSFIARETLESQLDKLLRGLVSKYVTQQLLDLGLLGGGSSGH